MVHWAQGVRRKLEDKPKFAKYDYGQACQDPFGRPQPCNQEAYGTKEPALYDLHSIKTPIAIFSGVDSDTCARCLTSCNGKAGMSHWPCTAWVCHWAHALRVSAVPSLPGCETQLTEHSAHKCRERLRLQPH